jgi:hypothetical protein
MCAADPFGRNTAPAKLIFGKYSLTPLDATKKGAKFGIGNQETGLELPKQKNPKFLSKMRFSFKGNDI